jgi:hypothetical protein
VVDTQKPVVRFLAAPGSYPEGADSVTRLDTHASMIFLAGHRAYKVKRAVSYPYMDFGTLAKRRAACVREVRLNRRTAPDLYLGVLPIRDTGEGRLSLGKLCEDAEGLPEAEMPEDATGAGDGKGTVVEYAVVLRRFDQADLLSEVAAHGGLTPEHIDALADRVAAFHDAADPVARDPVATHRQDIADNLADLAAHPDLLDPEAVADLGRATRACLERHAGLLAARGRDGRVRRCHGDLHLRNIVLWKGVPTPFDAIEFNDALAEIDVLYDLAFLVMDLDHRGFRAGANRLLSRYLTHRDDLEGLAALPLYLSLRAAIRAKVGLAALAGVSDPAARDARVREVRGYFAAARGYLDAPAARLVAVGGVSGTGKTTVARALAPEIGAAPGALVIRSDVERKRLFGVAETERLPESAYQGRVNATVYARVHDKARRALAAGRAVVLEATFLRREDRAALRKLAEEAGVPFTGLWLRAPAETLKARVTARHGDASDATAQVVAAQLERAPRGETAWPDVDASGPVEAVVEHARQHLRAAGISTPDTA